MNDQAIKRDFKTFFRLTGEPERTATGNGRWLTVKTTNCNKRVCVPLWVRVDKYVEEGQTVYDVAMPEWLAVKAGLL